MKSIPEVFLRLTRLLGTFLRRAPLLFAFIAGIVGVLAVDRPFSRTMLLVPPGLFLIAFLWRPASRSRGIILTGGLLMMILLGIRHQERLTAIGNFPYASALAAGQALEIEGEGWIADSAVYGARSISTMLSIDSVTVGERVVPCHHRVPVWIQKVTPGLAYGSRVAFRGRLLPLEGPTTPGGFDAKEFYFRQSGSLGRLEIQEVDRFVILPGQGGNALVAYARGLRGKLESALLSGISKEDEPYARLIAAMTLGARESSPEELEELFRISGTLHLFAVSGMHVGIVAGLLLGGALLLRLPRQSAVLLVIPCVLFYAILTGLSPSAVRAAVMFSAFLAAYALREKPYLLNSLGFSGLVLLLADSQQLFLPGFQLSFMVVFFIALFTAGLHRWIARPFLADSFIPASLLSPARATVDKVTGIVAASLAISLASWVGSAGLLAWHFQSISLVAIVANVFMVPFAGVIITLASFSLLASGVQMVWLAILGNKLNVGIAMALTGLAQFFASWPAASVNTGTIGGKAPESAVMRLDLMGDRGESAILLTIPGGGPRPLRWMIDSGGLRTYQGQVLPLLRSRGINRLDALVLTHGDSGHIGAAPEILALFRPPLLLESVAANRSPAHPLILARAESLATRIIRMDRSHRLLMGKNVVGTVLAPAAGDPGRVADDRALVLKVRYGDWTLLLTSDTGFATENRLLQMGTDLRADLWIRGQHSEGTPVQSAFVEAINPAVVLSSHATFPATEQIPASLRKTLSERGTPLFEIGPAGSIAVEVSREQLRVIPYAHPENALTLIAP